MDDPQEEPGACRGGGGGDTHVLLIFSFFLVVISHLSFLLSFLSADGHGLGSAQGQGLGQGSGQGPGLDEQEEALALVKGGTAGGGDYYDVVSRVDQFIDDPDPLKKRPFFLAFRTKWNKLRYRGVTKQPILLYPVLTINRPLTSLV